MRFFSIQIGSWLKKKELPTVRRFTTLDEKFLEDCKRMLNDYLSVSLILSVRKWHVHFLELTWLTLYVWSIKRLGLKVSKSGAARKRDWHLLTICFSGNLFSYPHIPLLLLYIWYIWYKRGIAGTGCSIKTRNTVSNAHKMIPPAPPCFVLQSPCFALGHPKIMWIEIKNRRCSMTPCSEQFLKVSWNSVQPS